MSDPFPAAGHKYLVDFRDDHGRGFKVQLEFHSEVSLTYVGVKPDGTLDTHPETVDITVEPIGERGDDRFADGRSEPGEVGKENRAKDTAEHDGDQNEVPCSDVQPADRRHALLYRNISAT